MDKIPPDSAHHTVQEPGGATICGSHEPIGIRSLFYSVGSLGISVSLLA